jgi:exopolyphosphatase/guanosine-5'-triphosphate,3'-diphosphate pyrophosphatase
MTRRGVTRARFVATQACRMASNGAAFLERVTRETGLNMELIAPEAEARLAVAGCLPLLDPSVPHALVFDIGGGSTEIVWLFNRHQSGHFDVLGWTSLPVGVVTLAERYGGAAMASGSYSAMVSDVEAMVAPFAARYRSGLPDPRKGRMQVLGTSGTVTTLAGVHMGLARYDRSKVDGSYISVDAITDVSHHLAGLSHADRAAYPCIGEDRADLVVAGCAILEAINRTFPAERLRVADRGLREGILAGLMEEADHEARRLRRARAEPRLQPDFDGNRP